MMYRACNLERSSASRYLIGNRSPPADRISALATAQYNGIFNLMISAEGNVASTALTQPSSKGLDDSSSERILRCLPLDAG
jgi:transcriptional regulator with XRE-family HTH domain